MEIKGKARVDGRTKNLVKRLSSHEIAVIDHTDIDELAAESLINCRPKAIINASQSITGRYPNAGPLKIIKAGVPLLDNAGQDVMQMIREGMRLSSPERIFSAGVFLWPGLLSSLKRQ